MMQQLDLNKTIKLLEKYKLPYPKFKIVRSEKQAIKVAEDIGYPIVLKIISKDIIHKSDVKGVKIGLKNKEELTSAYKVIERSAKRKKADVQGILVQKMEKGKEMIIGMKRDPQFDAVIMVGIGGIFVEILKDVSLRIAPIDRSEAEDMIDSLKGKRLLEGARGEKPIDMKKLIDIIIKVSKLSIENKKIKEIDLNPLLIDEKNANVVDARFMIE